MPPSFFIARQEKNETMKSTANDYESVGGKHKTFGGSKEATEENLHFFAAKLQELNQSNTRYTFRQWLNRTMNLLDLID